MPKLEPPKTYAVGDVPRLSLWMPHEKSAGRIPTFRESQCKFDLNKTGFPGYEYRAWGDRPTDYAWKYDDQGLVKA